MPIHVALDTQAFKAESFDFQRSPSLIALANAVSAGDIVVLLVDVTDREVRKHLLEQANAEAEGLKKTAERLRRLGPAAATLDASNAIAELEKLPLDQLPAARDAEWSDYARRIQATPLSTRDVDHTLVLDAYFARKPPFSDKKPKEFPDAFVIERLRRWADENKTPVYVVSADKDMQESCDGTRLLSIERIGAAIDEALRVASDEQARARDAIHEYLDENGDEIEEQLSERLGEETISVADDYDADVAAVALESSECFDFDVIELGDTEAEVEAAADIEFLVDAEVADYDSSPRDEGEYVFLNHNRIRYRARRTIRLTLTVALDADGSPSSVKQDSVRIFEPKQFEVGSGEDEMKILRSWSDSSDD